MTFDRALLFSLVVHLLLSLIVYKAPDLRPRPAERVEVQIVSDDDQKKSAKQFVTDPNLQKLKDANKKLKDTLKYLSREKVTVDQEQIANQNGPTFNGQYSRSPLTPIFQPQKPGVQDGAATTTDPSNTPTVNKAEAPGIGQASPKKQALGQNVPIPPSTIAEYIPDVRRGGFTSLNTDQFVYYTFYARINEQIRNRWVMNLKSFSDEMSTAELKKLASQTQITEVEVLVDSNGNFVKSVIHRHSQNPALDNAAAFAFQQAAPFLNPPTDIVKKDGLIHLYYAFYVDWN